MGERMDNNFYDDSRERQTNHGKKKPTGVMLKVISIQLVMSVLITATLYCIGRTDSELSLGIKSFYLEMSRTDIAVSQIFDNFKTVVKETFSPSLTVGKGETETATAGERSDFSPVFLTVNFQNPLASCKKTSDFGYRISPVTGEYSLHKGVDLSAPENTEIMCAFDGVVEKVSYHYMNGNYLIIRHSDELKTTYNHCSKILVEEGDRVIKSQPVALVGATGYATGNHLHFEVLLNGKYINPMWVLSYEL